MKSNKIPDEKRNKQRGENANDGIIVKGHAETLKAVIRHLHQTKCAMLDLSIKRLWADLVPCSDQNFKRRFPAAFTRVDRLKCTMYSLLVNTFLTNKLA